jgi:hypothetical protein
MMNVVPGHNNGGTQNELATPSGLGAFTWAVNGDGTKYKNIEENSYVYGYAFGTYVNNVGSYIKLGISSTLASAPSALTNYSGPFNLSIGYTYFAVKRPNINSGNNTIFVSSTSAEMGGYQTTHNPSPMFTHQKPTENGIPTPETTLGGWLVTAHFKYSTQKSW